MWNNSYKEISESNGKHQHANQNPMPATIASVEAGSIGEELGFEPGDKLVSINGTKPRDLIDYQFLIVEEELALEVLDSLGNMHKINLEKDADANLGIAFTEAIFDGLKQCNNHCPFCFIDQQPPGGRKSLYLKDDDYRLSFLYGSYLTLTNLNNDDWERIENQRLSPLYVSVHASDPKLRAKLLKNPRAVDVEKQLTWFAKRNLQIHAQIVICPGLNDGKALEKTLLDLYKFGKGEWPTVLSTAVVPVGLTRFRPQKDELVPVNSACALNVIQAVENLQTKFQNEIGTRFAWLSDEWYLIAKLPLPSRSAYEDLPQQENGVGSIRAFLESMDIATSDLPEKLSLPKTCSWVVGQLVEEALKTASNRLNEVEGLRLFLYGLPSPYWGQEEVVTGLLTGKDLLDGLRERELGEELLLPSVMLRQDEPLFLDGMTLIQLQESLKIPIRIVHGADEIVAAAIGNR